MGTLIKLKLVQGKILMFAGHVEHAYRLKIFFERFSINSAVLNAELPHATRQSIIQSFNQGIVDLLIATDDGFEEDGDEDDEDAEDAQEESEPEEVEPEEPQPKKRKKGNKKKSAEADGEDATPKAEEAKPKVEVEMVQDEADTM